MEAYANQSCCVYAGASHGKTYLAAASVTNQKSVLGLCFTNAGTAQLRAGGITNVHTFDSEFCEGKKFTRNYTRIIIDEFSMVPLHWWDKIYKLKVARPDLIIQIYGDTNQCSAINPGC